MSHAATWKIRPRGVWTVLALELRQRARSKKWYVTLVLWALLNLMVTVLCYLPLIIFQPRDVGVAMRVMSMSAFTITVFFAIFAMILVLPAMSAGAINGDRNDGTLAPLQVTLVSPAEIVLGKVLGGWAVGLVFLSAVSPLIALTGLISGASVFYLLRVLISIALVALYVVAIGVGFSALTRRQLGSVVLSYVVSVGVTLILPLLTFMSAPLAFFGPERTVVSYEVTYPAPQGDSSASAEPVCERVEEKQPLGIPELLVPPLVINPIVIVSDTSPPLRGDMFQTFRDNARMDGLQFVSTSMSFLAFPGHLSFHNECGDTVLMEDGSKAPEKEFPPRLPAWLLGNLAWGTAALGAFAYAVLRSRMPMGRLPKGHRIA